jgi:uncharacterized protein
MTGSRDLSGADRPMLLDLNKLHGQREHLERTFEPAAFDPQDSEYRVAAPVHLTVDVQTLGGDAFGVTGRVRARLEVVCSRCLEPFEVPVDAEFDLRYVSQSANTGEAEQEIGDDDLATAFYREGMLDLVELMREQFVLALPMKPLCAEDCRGLCAECGTNLNKGQCGCTPRWEDPRLAALKSLLPREKEN